MSVINSVMRQNPKLAKRARLLGLIEIMSMYNVDITMGDDSYVSDLLEPTDETVLSVYQRDDRDNVDNWPTSDGDEVNEMVW